MSVLVAVGDDAGVVPYFKPLSGLDVVRALLKLGRGRFFEAGQVLVERQLGPRFLAVAAALVGGQRARAHQLLVVL